MQTVKSAIIVVLLLTVSYSAYVALTAPPAELPRELELVLEEGFNPDFADSINAGQGPGDDLAGYVKTGDTVSDPPSFDIGSPSQNAGNRPPMDPPAMAWEPEAGSTPYDPTQADPGAASRQDANGVSSDLGAYGQLMTPGSEGAFSPPSDTTAAEDDLDALMANGGNPSERTGESNSAEGGSAFTLPGGNNAPPSGEKTADSPTRASPPATNDSIANRDVDGGPKSNPYVRRDSETTDTVEQQASRTALANAIATADRQQEKDRLRESLANLSLFYNSPVLTAEDRQALLDRLDWLAGEVIYSQRHLLEQPYRVSQGEDLQQIAAKMQVPWELLASINKIRDPASILPGEDLKVVKGPFRGEVDLDRQELTLFLGEMYAGRFPITAGNDPAPQPGSYSIQDKQTARTYYSVDSGDIASDDPRNPYGKFWIDLGDRMSIHGTASSPSSRMSGCIQLRTADARDVFSILSPGSAVSIVR